MIKRFTLAALMVLGYLSAHGQIVTSPLNPSLSSKSPAATGWRAASAITLGAATAEGDVSMENTAGSMEKIGEVKYAAAAEGDGSSTPLPAIQLVLKNETVGLEIYADNGKGVMKDVDVTYDYYLAALNTSFPVTVDANQADKDLRVYLSYMPTDILSLGLGYRQNVFTETFKATLPALGITLIDQDTKETETGISLVASLQIAEIFYLAGGLENMSKTGSLDSSAGSADYVENSWTNTYLGAGLMMGEPGQTQFRAEYSMILYPESDQAANGSELRNFSRNLTESYAALEVLFGNILLGYENRRYVYKKIEEGSSSDANTDRTDNVVLMGAGWVSEEGFSVSLYSIDYKRTDEDASSKTEYYPKGWALYGSYRF